MTDPQAVHPIVAVVSDIRARLKGVAGVNPTFMTLDDKAVALGELVRAEGQLAELRLRVLADAGDLADSTGAKDAGCWLAHQTRTRFTDARADLALAGALDRERPVLAAGMRDGTVTLDQAHVIHRALDALPTRVDADAVALAESKLVAHAETFGPKELGRLGRRILDVVAPRSPSRPKQTDSPPSKPTPPTRPASPCVARATAPPASPGSSPTPPQPGSRPTSKRSPTHAPNATRLVTAPTALRIR